MIKCQLPIFHRSSPAIVFAAFLASLLALFRRRAAIQLEILALRHQLGVLQRSVKRPKLTAADRGLWALLSEVWAGWRSALVIVKPETVIAWHRKGFRLFWTWKVRHGKPGRPAVPKEVRELIRTMSRQNPLWGAPRIHANCSSFQVLYVFLVLLHERRRIIHFNVTAHPTAEWTAQQLREAFPFDQIPRYLLRDRDSIFGGEFRKEVTAMGIQEVLSTPRSPWQRAYVERVIGTIRRECLDHVIVFDEASLYRHVKSFMAYYHESRTHLSLDKDAPEPRPVQTADHGRIVAIPQVGGLHHRYERRAA